MNYKLKHHELFTLQNKKNRPTSFGGNQAWYPNFWHKKSGCGPTTAANQMAYLAHTIPDLKPLYAYEDLDKKNYTRHMQDLFKYVTPGMMGVNHIDKLSKGVIAYALNRNITLRPHSFEVNQNQDRDHRALAAFVKRAFEADCPIAFLNLASGKEHRLYPWHWITITSAQISNERVLATASDEGQYRSFDLSLWYDTTPMHGGLVYFTAN